MPLIKNGAFADDTWIVVEDQDPLPEGKPAIVSLEHWQRERTELERRNMPLGVLLKSSESPLALGADVAKFQVIAIEFPSFRDGRGFSAARRLRTQLGFTGELRAVGHLIPDQAQFLIRCGFDAIAVKEGAKLADWQRGLSEFTVWYQPGVDHRVTAIARRHQGAKEARAAAE